MNATIGCTFSAVILALSYVQLTQRLPTSCRTSLEVPFRTSHGSHSETRIGTINIGTVQFAFGPNPGCYLVISW
ncbi:uncharacterized protein LAESUDRAFT_416344 [Laetiporus sulphureus 93-53]|uniref:Secreted protein n=1 Tax=Laetiporus sulphureus 93-53 TaxID=1314785 RepID=A0A165GE47_9APHY|nr:uncharacterized protein LAESUDRAFT_416344 [Laetiporus sulphureus 93-53]KZT10220.1 hypothetical protein LAESUDRAFT_416344 [Laetiporus sulphureus 93-53]